MKEIEQAFIATIIKNPELYDNYLVFIPDSEVFEVQTTRILWESIQQCRDNNTAIEPSILSHLSSGVVSTEYIASIVKHANKDNLEKYASILFNSYIKRKLVADINKVLERGKDLAAPELLMETMNTVETLMNIDPNADTSGKALIPKSTPRIIDGDNIVSYGLRFLDNIAGGGTRGEMMAIAARPGHGKTTTSVNLVKHMAEQGLTGQVFNREMSNIEFIKKLYVLESDILDLSMLRRRQLDQNVKDEIARLENVLVKKYDKIHFFDNIHDINGATSEILRKKPDFFIDDFVQMVSSEGTERKDKIHNIFMQYSRVAKRTKSHGIILSQMNREIERRVDLNPSLSDFADASEIEWFCETAVFLQHKHKYNHEEYPENILYVYCLKARYGKVGTYEVPFHGGKCKIGG